MWPPAARSARAWPAPGPARRPGSGAMSRPSRIARLPPGVREELQGWLRDPGITQTEATERANELLAALDLPPVSRHSVNRYDLRMRQAGRKLRQSREVAEAWIGKLGAAPSGQIGHLINELLRTLAFELSLSLQGEELDAESRPALLEQLRSLSLSTARLERAASENVKREGEIRRRAAEDLVAAVEREGGEGHRVSAERLREIVRDAYGV